MDASTLAISSMAMHAEVKFMPDPPCSSGISMPIRPLSNSDCT